MNLHELQTTFKKSQDVWKEKWNRYRFQAILVLCFLVWTPLLITETLQIQHSCHPMILFSNKLPEQCQQSLISNNPFSEQLKSNQPTDLLPTPNHSNLDAGTIGIAVGTTAAILGAPITVAAGISLLVWLAVKTLF